MKDWKLTTPQALVIGAFVLGVIIWACNSQSATGSPLVEQAAAAEVARLNQSIETFEAKLEEQRKALSSLQVRARWFSIRQSVVVFDASSEGFQRVDTDLASFAVSIADLKPYGDGTKLTINIGNISGADFDGVKLKLRCGRRLPAGEDGSPNLEDVDKPQYQPIEKEHNVLSRVKSGSWNPNSVILPNVKPDELDFVSVGVEVSQVYLANR